SLQLARECGIRTREHANRMPCRGIEIHVATVRRRATALRHAEHPIDAARDLQWHALPAGAAAYASRARAVDRGRRRRWRRTRDFDAALLELVVEWRVLIGVDHQSVSVRIGSRISHPTEPIYIRISRRRITRQLHRVTGRPDVHIDARTRMEVIIA